MSRIYSNLHIEGQLIYNNSPQSGYILTTDNDGLVSWTSSTSVLATASSDQLGLIRVGTGLTVSNSGILSLSNTSMATASDSTLGGIIVGSGLTMSNSGVLSLSNSGTDLGRVIYISASGSDSTAVVGDITKPFLTTYAAKGAAISGDTIHVFPQTFTYNNSDALGNQWNNRQDEMNLWKMGVTWYFEPNCKFLIINQTITGQDLYLIKPVGGTSSDNCTILGYLEAELSSIGSNSTNGQSHFFYGTPIGTDYGYTFYCEAKSIVSTTQQAIDIRRSVVLSPGISTKIVINCDIYNYNYTAGQSGVNSIIYVSGSDADLDISFTFRESINTNSSYLIVIRNTTSRTIINIKGDKLSNSTKRIFSFSNVQSTIMNVNVKEMYYGTGVLGGFPSVLSDDSGCTYTLNLTGNLIEYQANSVSSQILFAMAGTTGSTCNYVGDIYTNQISGSGRTIVYTQANNNIINITGNINYMGTATTTSTAFISSGGGSSSINFSGKIRGNFGCILTKPYNGTINIENSNIKSIVPTTTSSIMDNQGYSVEGNVNIRNSYIQMSSGSNFSNGSYIKALINNSIIVNGGTGSGLSNTTAYGTLQLLNSTIISGTNSINYTNSLSPVITSNSQVNNDYNITTLYGNIDTLTNITF